MYRSVPADIPALGPVWFGAVMSTAAAPLLLLTFLGSVPSPWLGAVHGIAFSLWCAATAVCVLLTSIFGYRSAVDPARFRKTWMTAPQVLPWGAAAIGFLALGGATPVVLPALWPSTFVVARAVTWPLWLLGSVIGLACLVRFTQLVRAGAAGKPTVGWGLAVMPTLVGSNLTAEMGVLHPGAVINWFLAVVSALQFFVGLVGLLVVFVLGYHALLRHTTHVPPAVYPTLFMPIGLAGQSAASSQQQFANVSAVASAGFVRIVEVATVVQSVVLLPLGVLALVYALARFIAGMVNSAPFTPAWLSMAFPLASLSLGTAGLSGLLEFDFLWGAGAAFAVLFAAVWLVGVVAALRALYHLRGQWLAPFRIANYREYAVQRWHEFRHPSRRTEPREPSSAGGHSPIREREIRWDDTADA